MENYRYYIKKKKHKLIWLTIVLLLLEISAVLLFPHVIQQWSHDRKIGVLHLGIGLVLGLIGVMGSFVLWKDICTRHGMDWKKELVKWALCYLVIQTLMGVLQGGLGELIYRVGPFSYESIKKILYITGILFQNMLRMLFILGLTGYLNGLPPRRIKSKWKGPVGMALIFSVFSVCIGLFIADSLIGVIQVLSETIYIIIAVIICGTVNRRKTDV